MNNLHTLTPLTGRKADEHRTATIAGVDMRRETLKIGAVAVIPAVAISAAAWPLLGARTVFVFAFTIVASWWGLATRSTTGLRRRRFEGFLDKRRSSVGVFMLCGRPIDPDLHEVGMVLAAGARKTTAPAGEGPQPVTGRSPAGAGDPRPLPALNADELFGGSR